MTEVIAISALAVVYMLGFLLGMFTKGINITINHKAPEVKEPVASEEQKFNTSTADMLPDDVKLYFQKNQGFVE